MKDINITRWLSLIIGILFIVTGFFSLMNPGLAVASIANFFSLMLIAIGILKVIRYFSNSLFKIGSFLIAGILDILLGILMFRNLASSIELLRFFMAFWILIIGVTEIATSIDLKNMELDRWWLGLISGILGIIVGYAIIAKVAFFVGYTSVLFAFYMILLGANFISTFIGLTRLRKFIN